MIRTSKKAVYFVEGCEADTSENNDGSARKAQIERKLSAVKDSEPLFPRTDASIMSSMMQGAPLSARKKGPGIAFRGKVFFSSTNLLKGEAGSKRYSQRESKKDTLYRWL